MRWQTLSAAQRADRNATRRRMRYSKWRTRFAWRPVALTDPSGYPKDVRIWLERYFTKSKDNDGRKPWLRLTPEDWLILTTSSDFNSNLNGAQQCLTPTSPSQLA